MAVFAHTWAAQLSVVPNPRAGAGERISADDLMIGERDAQLRAAVSALRSDELLRFVARQHRFGGKGSAPTPAHGVDVIPLPWSGGSYGIARVNVRDAGTGREYQLLVGLRAEAPIHPAEVIAKSDT